MRTGTELTQTYLELGVEATLRQIMAPGRGVTCTTSSTNCKLRELLLSAKASDLVARSGRWCDHKERGSGGATAVTATASVTPSVLAGGMAASSSAGGAKRYR